MTFDELYFSNDLWDRSTPIDLRIIDTDIGISYRYNLTCGKLYDAAPYLSITRFKGNTIKVYATFEQHKILKSVLLPLTKQEQ